MKDKMLESVVNLVMRGRVMEAKSLVVVLDEGVVLVRMHYSVY
jgi:hypothetical protein